MSKSLLAIIAFFVCTMSTQAQFNFALPELDDFDRGIMSVNSITTELIECSPSSNVYNRIDIHRNYGVPRFGIVWDCSQNVDTVWYIPNTFNMF